MPTEITALVDAWRADPSVLACALEEAVAAVERLKKRVDDLEMDVICLTSKVEEAGQQCRS